MRATPVYELNPLEDIRWAGFLECHDTAGLFHSTGWLDALRRTYGFEARVLTTSGPSERLANGLVFCRIRSRLTGRRLVSVPFSDHCAPLTDNDEELQCLVSRLQEEAVQEKYLEIRSIASESAIAAGFTESSSFCLHRLDLRPTLNELCHAFHGDCIRRKIRRAERENVTYEDGTSEAILQKFYRLVIRTRRRQRIPPQPMSWFRNLIGCIGEGVKIRLVSHKEQPVAGILTIRYKRTMTYKYGCSEPQFHKFGSMQMLIWKAIQDAKESGLREFDMGRTDWTNEGLLKFKDRWGSTRCTLRYLRYPPPSSPGPAGRIVQRIAGQAIASAPEFVLTLASGVLYRHFA